jgi:hypothetical protein
MIVSHSWYCTPVPFQSIGHHLWCVTSHLKFWFHQSWCSCMTPTIFGVIFVREGWFLGDFVTFSAHWVHHRGCRTWDRCDILSNSEGLWHVTNKLNEIVQYCIHSLWNIDDGINTRILGTETNIWLCNHSGSIVQARTEKPCCRSSLYVWLTINISDWDTDGCHWSANQATSKQQEMCHKLNGVCH